MGISLDTKAEVRNRGLDHVHESDRDGSVSATNTVKVLNPAPKLRNGSRYRRLKSFAHWLVTAGCIDVLGVLRAHNEFYCHPPLDDHDVQQIAARAVGTVAEEVL